MLLWSFPVRADQAEELTMLHREVSGGAERLAALAALRATGSVVMNGKRVRFTLTATRPNRVRLETEAGDRILIQGYDGIDPPWEFEPGAQPPRYRELADAAARRIIADAEYDDPLLAGQERGYAIDFAGETEANGRKYLRLLVTHRLIETFSLLIDPETFLIEFRMESHAGAGGRQLQIVTRYDQYQPVDGVLLPHEITTTIDGRVTQEMKIDRIEPNPEIGPEAFSRPAEVSPPDPSR